MFKNGEEVQHTIMVFVNHQGLDGWYLLHQRRGVEGPSCAGAGIAGAGDRGGISVRRRAGNAGLQYQLRAATTIDSVIRATATAAVAPASAATITAVSEAIAASRRHPAKATHGAAADFRADSLEGGAGLRCANDSPLRHAERADLLVVSTKRPAAPSQRRTPVKDEQDCAAVDGDYAWRRRRRPPQQAVDFWGPRVAVTFHWGPRRDTTGWGAQRDSTRHGDNAHLSGGHRRNLGRPAAALQAAGSATLSRLLPQGTKEPQRGYAFGARSSLEGFGGVGGSWAVGYGDV